MYEPHLELIRRSASVSQSTLGGDSWFQPSDIFSSLIDKNRDRIGLVLSSSKVNTGLESPSEFK